jgi:hypothetical protein
MDTKVWRLIRRAIRSADRSIPRRRRRPRYGDRLIVAMYFWSVAHDRPLRWACERSSYGRLMRPRRLCSVSQFCKRIKQRRAAAMIRRVHEVLAGPGRPAGVCFMDGKALPVSESSADPDARTGRGNGRFSRGYKLHALADSSGKIRDFRVRPLNRAEPTVARSCLVRRLAPGTLVLADGNYDGKHLYTAVQRRGAFLLTPQKSNPRTDAAFAATSPARRRAMELWRDRPALARSLYALRGGIERVFSALSSYGGGLGPLPAWVRRLPRVTRWVTAKIALYNARGIVRTGAS